MGSSSTTRLTSAVVAIAGLLYAAICGYLWLEQRRLIFLPDAAVTRTPAAVGLAFQEVRIAVVEQGAVDAWWLPAASDPSSASVLLYFRGNDGNLGREVDRLRALHRHGLPILAIDYRGYGRSSGPAPSEAQVYADARAAWDYLVHEQAVAPDRIVIYGHSLGAAVAIELALQRGPACGLVLEAAFTSMSDMGKLVYPWIPVDSLLRERFDNLSKIGRLQVPMLFVHGMADDIVPPAMTESLHRVARGDKQLLMVEGAGHEDAMPKAGARMANTMAHFARACGRS